MQLAQIAADLGLECLVSLEPEREVRGGYCSDLLSDVLAHTQPGDLWITHQRHLNVVAVGKLREVAGIVFARGLRPSPDVVARAQTERVSLFVSPDPAFEVAGRLYRALHP